LLSPREVSCLQHAADGQTSARIAEVLGISARTVDGYISAACAKLNARGRQAAITKATNLQLIGHRNSLQKTFVRQRDQASLVQAPGKNTPP
jgi:DNA-binding CsgD family transcriptional regulator